MPAGRTRFAREKALQKTARAALKQRLKHKSKIEKAARRSAKASAERIEHFAITPQIRKGLRNDAHAHPHFLVGLLIRIFRANRARLVNRAQALFVNDGAN